MSPNRFHFVLLISNDYFCFYFFLSWKNSPKTSLCSSAVNNHDWFWNACLNNSQPVRLISNITSQRCGENQIKTCPPYGLGKQLKSNIKLSRFCRVSASLSKKCFCILLFSSLKVRLYAAYMLLPYSVIYIELFVGMCFLK